MTSIKGYIEGIIDGVANTPDKMEEYLETARSKAMLVNAMIDDLLLYSKLDLNQIPYHFEKKRIWSSTSRIACLTIATNMKRRISNWR